MIKNNKKGFTLVELLVVVAVIGILAVVATPALFSNIKKAKIAELQADYSAFRAAALVIYAEDTRFEGDTADEDKGEVSKLDNLNNYIDNLPTTSPFGGKYRLHSNGGGNAELFFYPIDGKVDTTKSLDENYKEWKKSETIDGSKLTKNNRVGLKIVDVPKTLSSKDFQRILDFLPPGEIGLIEEDKQWDIFFKLIK